MLNTFLRRRKDYLGYKIQGRKRKSVTNKDRLTVLRICANVCATCQLPPNVSENAKQDTLLSHCNLLGLDHLKRMTEFGIQGERGLAGFQ